MKLLKKMCNIHSPSGEEFNMTKFIIDYIDKNKKKWSVIPKIYCGENLQDNIILCFGKPRTAIFAHLDSVGFTVGYNNEIHKIGSPKTEEGIELSGNDSKGRVEGKITRKKNRIFIDNKKIIDRGTSLTFSPKFRETEKFVQCCYMDNRLGVWNALKIAETLENGMIVFSSWEEHGGGSVGYLAKFIYEKYGVKQALISDITWITKGIKHGEGVVISLRDSGIPRKSYLNKIIKIAKLSNIPFQLEVENSGGSDGNHLQMSPYPFDWCFIGAAESFVHSPNEKVHKFDIETMTSLYKYLMKKL